LAVARNTIDRSGSADGDTGSGCADGLASADGGDGDGFTNTRETRDPWERRSSVQNLLGPTEQLLTSIRADVLADHILDLASVHCRDALRLERSSVLAGLEHASVVHGALEGVTFPSENVISVSSVATAVVVAHEERVLAVGGPHVGELGSVIQGLVSDLRYTDGMRGGARAGVLECVSDGVEHVRLMVGRVEGLAIPASICRLESVGRSDHRIWNH